MMRRTSTSFQQYNFVKNLKFSRTFSNAILWTNLNIEKDRRISKIYIFYFLLFRKGSATQIWIENRLNGIRELLLMENGRMRGWFSKIGEAKAVVAKERRNGRNGMIRMKNRMKWRNWVGGRNSRRLILQCCSPLLQSSATLL